MKVIYSFITTFFIVFILYMFYLLFLQFDSEYNNNQYFIEREIKPDCNYKLPNQYYIAYDSANKKYAIVFMHLDTYRHFLYLKRYATLGIYVHQTKDHTQASKFDDSCTAKGLFKYYQKQKAKEEKENIDNFIIK